MAWRRAIHAVADGDRLPVGQRLHDSGRDHGDLVIRLLPDDPETRPQVLDAIPVPERLPRPHSVVAALKQAPGRLGASNSCAARALRILHALACEAERRGHTVGGAPDKGSTIRVVVRGHSYYGGGQRAWPLKRLTCINAKTASLHLIAPVI